MEKTSYVPNTRIVNTAYDHTTTSGLYEYWRHRKCVLIENIDKTIIEGNVEKETLEVMKELLNSVKVRKKTMKEYFEEQY